MTICTCRNCILSPHILDSIIQNGSKDQKMRAENTARLNMVNTMKRAYLNKPGIIGYQQAYNDIHNAPNTDLNRAIYDAHGDEDEGNLILVKKEGDADTHITNVEEVYSHTQLVYNFYKQVFKRDSYDNKGGRLISIINYGTGYDNAFWDGEQMIYGSGDGDLFTSFTQDRGISSHELTHGVTQYVSGLQYYSQSGALNESISDVFALMCLHWADNATWDKGTWLIGSNCLARSVQGRALRDIANPGTAYDDPVLGKDPQPNHMNSYYEGTSDNQGVHINSSIPSLAFYHVCQGLGGHIWLAPGTIWYGMCNQLVPNSIFTDACRISQSVAMNIYGAEVAQVVADAWNKVGVT